MTSPDHALRGALERAALAALFAFVAWGPLAQGSTFPGGRAGLTVLGLLTGGLYLAASALSPAPARPWRSPWALCLWALLGWLTLSVLRAPAGAAPQGLLLAGVMLAALSARGLLVSARRRAAFGAWLLGLTVLMAAYVAAQHLGGGWTLQVDPDTLSGTYYHPSHYTGWVTLALPVCVWAVFQGPQWWVRAAGLSAGVILTGSLLHTNSSSLPTALLAAALAGVLAIWRRHRLLGSLAAAALLAGVGAGVWLLATPPGRHALDDLMGGIQTKSVDRFLVERGKLWTMDAQAAQAAPVTGVGPGNFVSFIPRFRPERAEGPYDLAFNFVNYAHNDYYQLAIELGWTGLALYAALLLLTLAAAPRQDPLGASVTAGLVALWISGLWDAHATVVPGTMAWAWVACGLIAARAWGPLPAPGAARDGRPGALTPDPGLITLGSVPGGKAHE
ncbi:O-antigen ligase family protein (plasmid) [Deinococcus taeanensis]|uniref:O-antigen ligase family protein n=1 Tax=Deinococcus taeanensis TaxID=2737050 RepID=UPI001CDD2463|nr:O-antigen ligase family protein [Deinococcus taeanensis]UBV44317.1 O-antigen ligase family protein [Deinococcus taeanensis]